MVVHWLQSLARKNKTHGNRALFLPCQVLTFPTEVDTWWRWVRENFFVTRAWQTLRSETPVAKYKLFSRGCHMVCHTLRKSSWACLRKTSRKKTETSPLSDESRPEICPQNTHLKSAALRAFLRRWRNAAILLAGFSKNPRLFLNAALWLAGFFRHLFWGFCQLRRWRHH